MSNELLWSWAAGIVDGEGSISIFKVGKDSYSIVLHVGMSHKETINRIRTIFGDGQVREDKQPKGRKTMYVLRLYGKRAVEIVTLLLPHLFTKKRQAELVIEFNEKCSTDRGKQITEEVSILRELIYGEIRDLNRRGTS